MAGFAWTNARTSSSGASHGGTGGTIPANATTRTSSPGAAAGATSGSYTDILRAIKNENNAFNVAQTEMVNAFNAAEAQKQRDWQTYMSNTAHQREIADLKAAGLNPILSALNGNGAAVPTGAAASGQKAVADNTLGNGIISMMAAMINASSAASVASIYANASMYSANQHLAGTKYASDVSSAASIENSKRSTVSGLIGSLIGALMKKVY